MRSGLHHPDLVAAADVVVGKPGYSTVAEAVAAGTPYLVVARPGFPEGAVHAARRIATLLTQDAVPWGDSSFLSQGRARERARRSSAE